MSDASLTLSEDQIESLRPYGETRNTEVGQVLFRAGDATSDFIVVLEGEVEVIDNFAGEARTMGRPAAGFFLGELNLLTGQALYLTFVVRKAGKVLALSREQLKKVVTEDPTISDIILKVFLARRSMGMRAGVGLRIIGSRHSSDATRLRESRPATVWPTAGSSSGKIPEPRRCSQSSARRRQRRRWRSGRARRC
jgi:thioredoxin reductase (NADPH)